MENLSVSEEMKQKLIQSAFRQTAYSYAPYSEFHVGAALLAADGQIFMGCNVENASFGAGICAERNALFHAVSAGVREFAAIAVVGGRWTGEGVGITDYCYPCGICLQALSEFCSDDFCLLFTKDPSELLKRQEKVRIFERKLKELLPYGFRAENMQ